MDLWQIFISALGSQEAGTLLVTGGVYVASPTLVYFYVEAWKRGMRRAGRPKPGPWAQRAMAAVGTFALAMFVANRLGGWPVEQSANHAVSIALFFPLMMWALLALLTRQSPEAADGFGRDVFDDATAVTGPRSEDATDPGERP